MSADGTGPSVETGSESDDPEADRATAEGYNAFLTRATIEGADGGALDGRRVALKDNISTKGVRTTCGSAMLAEYVPPYDATVVKRLTEAGATIVGKTNMDEFGMGGTTETSAFGPTENPLAPGRVAGGSSGGSAAAVAAGAADLALGSDTGGSIRNPAAFCGVVGIKPTYGLVSRYGLVAYANSLEQIGPIAPTVREAAELLEVIAGPDERDATTRAPDGDEEGEGTAGSDADERDTVAQRGAAEGRSYAAAADGAVGGMTIGVPSALTEGADERVVSAFEASLEALEAEGARVREVTLESIEHALAAYYVIAMGEASSNLARFDGVRYGISGGDEGNWNDAFARSREAGFGEEVKRRVLLGTYALSAGYHEKYYKKAQDARAWIKRDFESAFETVDVLASPTMPVVPPRLGERIDDPLRLYLMDANTVPVNLANLPAISVPAVGTPAAVDRADGGDDGDGLPVGVQFVGRAFDEETVIRAGSALD